MIGECKVTLPLLSYVIGDVVLSATAVFEKSMGADRLVKVSARNIEDFTTGNETVLVYAGTADGKVFIVSMVKNDSNFSIQTEKTITKIFKHGVV